MFFLNLTSFASILSYTGTYLYVLNRIQYGWFSLNNNLYIKAVVLKISTPNLLQVLFDILNRFSRVSGPKMSQTAFQMSEFCRSSRRVPVSI